MKKHLGPNSGETLFARVTWGFVKPPNVELSMTSQVSVTISARQKRTFLFLSGGVCISIVHHDLIAVVVVFSS